MGTTSVSLRSNDASYDACRVCFPSISMQLEHARSKVLIVDCELAGVAKRALEMIPDRGRRPRLIQAEDSRHPEWTADDGEELKDFMRYR